MIYSKIYLSIYSKLLNLQIKLFKSLKMFSSNKIVYSKDIY